MSTVKGTNRLLLGIEVTLLGGVIGFALAPMTSSGLGPVSPVGIAVALVGLVIALAGYATRD